MPLGAIDGTQTASGGSIPTLAVPSPILLTVPYSAPKVDHRDPSKAPL